MDRHLINQLLDQAGASRNRDVLAEILRNTYELAAADVDRLDLKITRDAVKEMTTAFRMFAPYAHIPKVTVFGSARTHPTDPLYDRARELARLLADAGWMVVTGAGPGIMAAATEGAGADRSFGVTIRLPFEEGANELLEGSDRVVSMKYFFTRKLMLMKESSGFVALPGGFGTQDEVLELLTLMQTGKATPAPLVLLDLPGETYWESWERFVRGELVEKGLISPGDTNLYTITDDVDAAAREIRGFWRNYDSIRWVGQRLVVRLRAEPTDEELAMLNERFGHLCVEGGIERSEPLRPEVSDNDKLDLPRLVLRFSVRQGAGFRDMIRVLNSLDSAPPLVDVDVPARNVGPA
ncbi:MAG TPA: TIGR00730 family Rossman fold protein [Acidimicrobiales bacterium]